MRMSTFWVWWNRFWAAWMALVLLANVIMRHVLFATLDIVLVVLFLYWLDRWRQEQQKGRENA